ncbi:MAG: hydrolase [Spirochaetaceae bacterium]
MRIPEERTTVVVIDVQEKLVPVMSEKERLIERISRFVRGAGILGLPLVMTEQYPRGLGATVAEVGDAFREAGGTRIVEKKAFSCCDEPGFMRVIEGEGRRFVVLLGIESHVCMLQTTMDLLAAGYQPVVPVDTTSSRFPEDRQTAFERMRDEGAIITTSESLLFELTRVTGTPRFKEISRLVR